MRFSSLLILIFLFISKTLFSQYLVTDTIYIQFKYNTFIPVNFYTESVNDNRKPNEKLISYTKKKKLLLIPVDQEIYFDKPINEYLLNSLRNSPKTSDTLAFEIDRFKIDKYKGRFSTSYVLEADIQVLKDDEFKGTLSYNYRYSPNKRKTPRPVICEELLTDWNTQFRLDLLTTSNFLNKIETEKPDNFLVDNFKRPTFFNLTVGTVLGLDFWQLEGEMYFTRPETEKNRWFKSVSIRYQNVDEFEMIGFGKKLEHFNKRLTPNIVFDLNTNFLIGINKWKNSDDVKLQQVIQFSFSSTQSINFDKKNKAGWLLKAGLFENVYYIIEKPVKLQVGLYLSTGYKF